MNIFFSDVQASEQTHGRVLLEHDSLADGARMEHQQISTGAEFKSFLGEEGPHGPPLSCHLSTPQIKQQLFDFSLGERIMCQDEIHD